MSVADSDSEWLLVPLFGASGCYEIRMTKELLDCMQEGYVNLRIAFHKKDYGRWERRLQPFRSPPELDWAFVLLGVFTLLGSLIGALVCYARRDWTGVVIWVLAVFICLLCLLLFFAERRVKRLMERVKRSIDTQTIRSTRSTAERHIRRSLEPVYFKTPYLLFHELDAVGKTWTMRAQRIGEYNDQTSAVMQKPYSKDAQVQVGLSSGMRAMRSADAVLLLSGRFFPRVALFAPMQSDDQVELVRAFLNDCGVVLCEPAEVI